MGCHSAAVDAPDRLLPDLAVEGSDGLLDICHLFLPAPTGLEGPLLIFLLLLLGFGLSERHAEESTPRPVGQRFETVARVYHHISG